MESYGNRLRRVLGERGVSVRELATRMNPANPETARRHINRVLAGGEPRERTRAEIAAALGVDRKEIEGEDDEEADMVAVLLERVMELSERTHELRRVAERVSRKRA